MAQQHGNDQHLHIGTKQQSLETMISAFGKMKSLKGLKFSWAINPVITEIILT